MRYCLVTLTFSGYFDNIFPASIYIVGYMELMVQVLIIASFAYFHILEPSFACSSCLIVFQKFLLLPCNWYTLFLMNSLFFLLLRVCSQTVCSSLSLLIYIWWVRKLSLLPIFTISLAIGDCLCGQMWYIYMMGQGYYQENCA